jgi:hypothetical protein
MLHPCSSKTIFDVWPLKVLHLFHNTCRFRFSSRVGRGRPPLGGDSSSVGQRRHELEEGKGST